MFSNLSDYLWNLSFHLANIWNTFISQSLCAEHRSADHFLLRRIDNVQGRLVFHRPLRVWGMLQIDMWWERLVWRFRRASTRKCNLMWILELSRHRWGEFWVRGRNGVPLEGGDSLPRAGSLWIWWDWRKARAQKLGMKGLLLRAQPLPPRTSCSL